MPTTETLRHSPAAASTRAYLASLMAEIDRASISVRLRDSLKESGLTQREAADYMHVHVRSIEDWTSPKKRVVPFDQLDEWAGMTGVTKEWLLHGEAQEGLDVRLEAVADALRALELGQSRVLSLLEGLAGQAAPQSPPRVRAKPKPR